MKKTYVFLLILLVLAVGSVGVIGSIVNGQKDDVTIRESVVYGDKSAAEGITIVNQTHMRHHLFWETTYHVGEKTLCETDYTYVPRGKEIEQKYVYYGIDVQDDVGYYYSGKDNPVDMQKEFEELYDTLKKGETKSKDIYIKDYYDYYPIRMNINLPNTVWVNNDPETEVGDNPFDPKYVINKFQEFFKIPVLETDYVRITVSKAKDSPNSNVAYSEERSSEPNFYQVVSVSAYTDNVCYFAINNRSTQYEYSEDSYNRVERDGAYVDTSLIPGGYGIYSFSYGRGAGEYHTGIDADSLQMVFSLEQDVSVKHMMIRDNQTRLILITEEDEGAFVKVIDLATMKEVQNIRLDKTLYNQFGRYANIFEYEDFISIVYGENIVVISEQKGVYVHEFTVPVKENERCYFPNTMSNAYSISMDFDGEKLAVVGMQGENFGYNNCDYCLLVYDASGLLYFGEYITGMSKYDCDPVLVDTYRVNWK